MFGYGRSKIKKKKNLSVYSRFRFLDSVCLKWVYLKQWPKVSVNTNTAYNPPPHRAWLRRAVLLKKQAQPSSEVCSGSCR